MIQRSSACPRSDAHDGEDYACWMATLFTPLRCPGPGGCADPLQCSPALVEIAMQSQESSGLRGAGVPGIALRPRGAFGEQRSNGLRAKAG